MKKSEKYTIEAVAVIIALLLHFHLLLKIQKVDNRLLIVAERQVQIYEAAEWILNAKD